MKKIIITGYVLLVMFSCNNNTTIQQKTIALKDTIAKTNDTPIIQSLPAEKVMDTIFTHESDTAFKITHGSIYIVGYSKPSSPRTYTLTANKGQLITATIHPIKKNGNVRINQLQYPDKKFDGPFGDSTSYTMPIDGKLSFIIGQNMMAGNPWRGEFILFIKAQ